MKPPAASKFLQRGGLGEAHWDNLMTMFDYARFFMFTNDYA